MMNSKNEPAYLDLIRYVLDNGTAKGDRTGTGTLSHFGAQLRFDLADGFPLLTTKKVHFKSIVYELLWFLKGDTHVKYLQDNGVRIWKRNGRPPSKPPNLVETRASLAPFMVINGETISKQGRQWQLWSRRHRPNRKRRPTNQNQPQLSTFDCVRLESSRSRPSGVAPVSHVVPVFVANGKLSCQLYQRSADLFLACCLTLPAMLC